MYDGWGTGNGIRKMELRQSCSLYSFYALDCSNQHHPTKTLTTQVMTWLRDQAILGKNERTDRGNGGATPSLPLTGPTSVPPENKSRRVSTLSYLTILRQ